MQQLVIICVKILGFVVAGTFLRTAPLPALALGGAAGAVTGAVLAIWPMPPSPDYVAPLYRRSTPGLATWRRILAGVALAAMILGGLMVQAVPEVRGLTLYFIAYIVVLAGVAALTSRRSFEAHEEALARMAPKGTIPVAPPPVAAKKLSIRECIAVVGGLAMLAMPFVQYVAVMTNGSRRAFLLPLAAFLALQLAFSLLPKRRAAASPPNHGTFGRWIALFAVGLAGALALPATGFILVARGIFADCLAVLATIYLTRLRNSRPLPGHP